MELHRSRHTLYRAVHAGFTIIELLVVLVIIVIISMVVLTSQSSFNKTLILSNTAYDIALAFRSAQTYGLGSRASSISSNAGYGLDFVKTVSPDTPNTFIFFADTYPGPSSSNCHGLSDLGASAPDARPGNCFYNPTTDPTNPKDQIVSTYTLENGITISDFCAIRNGNSFCLSKNNLNQLDITFARPNADVSIARNGAPPPTGSNQFTRACIKITSPQGGYSYISVSSSGQIIANATSCP